jgi:hypothetical protein
LNKPHPTYFGLGKKRPVRPTGLPITDSRGRKKSFTGYIGTSEIKNLLIGLLLSENFG